MKRIPMSSKQNQESIFHTIQFMEDVPQQLVAEIARTETLLRDILTWKSGSIVAFPKIIGEPVEIILADRLLARGEVVVINDRFGVRITEITHPAEKPGEVKRSF